MLCKKYLKKALILSAFFIATPLHALSCSPATATQTARVKWVYDGDTVKLDDGRKLRIIGIDAPEMPHSKRKGERYAGEASELLRELLKKGHYRIKFQTGKEPQDKYGRLLAHVFTPDNINVAEWLLEKGLATTLVIPPNTGYADCYFSAQRNALHHRYKIWSLQEFKRKTPAQIHNKQSGYVLLQGTVQRIIRRKGKLTIRLDQQIYITIKGSDLRLFNQQELDHLRGKQITVSGIMYTHGNKHYIRIRHPGYLGID